MIDGLDPSARQREAADRNRSVWVAASAGTGKTKVLTDRVLNLLLGGTAPDRLLCLTFTKAAAAEMANRLNARLSKWVTAGDVELSAEIAGITGAPPAPGQREAARRLFARVLDTPGGMRILTIHAFCQSVLRRFPLEAGVAPQFEVADDRSAAELLAEAAETVLTRARAEGAAGIGAALAEVTAHAGEQRFHALMQEVALERGRLAGLIERAGGLGPYLALLAEALGLAPGETEAGCRAALCAEAAFDGPGLRRAAAALSASKAVTDQRTGEGLAAWLAAPPEARAAGFDAYFGLFLTLKLEPRARLATKAVLAAQPELEEILLAEQARLVRGRQRIAAAAVLGASAALARLADAFLAAYATEKRRRNLLDYDDLILGTRDLLARPGVAPWVLFKLDGGLDHILIDEAQDTNPDQWAVIRTLAEEFFTGRGAAEAERTIFAVGDAKQSIFSFQRADPHAFLAMHDHFAGRVTDADKRWSTVPLQVSFRSTQAVLDVVDAVFARDEARDGVALDGSEIRHLAYRAGQAGRVELWPALRPDEPAEAEPWQPPLEQQSQGRPRARLARLVAQTIAHWIAAGERLPSKDRPIRAGDVLVLLRRRGGFVAELVRELKRLEVPVAGTDRMVLTRQLAVMDLMALGRFLLLPEDDLTLASVLKGPLVGFDDERLLAVAQGRPGSLWSALRDRPEPWAAEAACMLQELLARADFMPPHELYAELLGAGAGRRRLLARLGHEASDAIDELLAQTLAYERAHVPSLQGFLHWLESGEAEVKRDLDQAGRDEVRIMTVHGSKGLQAPIVFLPDTVAVPTQGPSLLWPEEAGIMLWAPPRGAGEPVSSRARAAALARRDQEYRRLLYVALTRAEDRLYVCGWQTARSSGRAAWYDLVQEGLQALGARRAPIALPPGAAPFDGDGLVHDGPQTAPPVPDGARPADAAPVDGLPPFALAPPPPEPSPPRPLIASRPSGEEPAPLSPLGAGADRRRFQRGLLIHRLMQSLPGQAPAAAEAAARRYLSRPAHGLAPAEQAAILAETMEVLRHPEFAALFGPGSRAEVPVVGLLDGRALSGRIDRLVLAGDTVLIVDYKTNRPPPEEEAAVAPAYREQLAAYRAALERIYLGRRVRTLLLWTDGPRLMEIAP